MITALQQRKLDKAFGFVDFDGNGELELEDVLALGTRILARFQVPPDGPLGRHVFNTFTDFWEALLVAIDLDGNRKIDPQEWRLGMAGAFIETEGGYEASLRPAVRAALAVADTNGDGVLGLAEFLNFQAAFGTTPEDAEIAFRKIDTDDSDDLTVEELVAAAREYYVGDDPDVPGNWLFGPV